jgi:hypothetical protein
VGQSEGVGGAGAEVFGEVGAQVRCYLVSDEMRWGWDDGGKMMRVRLRDAGWGNERYHGAKMMKKNRNRARLIARMHTEISQFCFSVVIHSSTHTLA